LGGAIFCFASRLLNRSGFEEDVEDEVVVEGFFVVVEDELEYPLEGLVVDFEEE